MAQMETSDAVQPTREALLGVASGQEHQETRLVIGLDYGTTFTGVAYTTASGERCSLRQIALVTDWGPQMHNHDKVPSVISCPRASTGGEQQWGSSLQPDAVAMVHTKLELDMQDVLGELDMTLSILEDMNDLNFGIDFVEKSRQNLPPYSHQGPQKVVTDFLKQIFQWLEEEHAKIDVLRKHTATDIVVTTPAQWSYMAINSMYRALRKAGLNQTKFPILEDVIFVTEPEAAALYAAHYYRDLTSENLLRENQYFILCDAGGGTVQVSSYQVKALHPVLQLNQIGTPTGRKCGSIFIDQEFKRWIRQLLGDQEYQKLDPKFDIRRTANYASETPAMRALMKKFGVLKESFNVDSREVRLTLPQPLDYLSIPNKVKEGLVIIPKEAMEHFFDTCINEILLLIKRHIARIERQGSRPKNLFLVGGFGESQYLQYHLENTFMEEDWHIRLRRPGKSSTAALHGAVICGVEKNTIRNLRRASPCRHSYAICLDEMFSRMYHPEMDRAHLNGQNVAVSQLLWLLNKGDLILSDQKCKVEKEFDLRLGKPRQDTVKVQIYRHTGDEQGRPTRYKTSWEELKIACELTIDLSKLQLTSNRSSLIRRGSTSKMYQITLKIVLEFDWDILEASIWWQGRKLTRDSVFY